MPTHRTKILLLRHVVNVGKQGDIVEVSSAQARNFLIPKGLAKEIDEKALSDMKARETKARENSAELVKNKQAIRESLHLQTLDFPMRGQGEKVFGGISEHEIIEKIKHEYGYTLEKRHIVLPEGKHLKTPGDHDIRVNLGHEVYIRMTVRIRVVE